MLERINPAKILPINRRLIGLINIGLFSLMFMRGGKRGCPSKEDNASAVNSCEGGSG